MMSITQSFPNRLKGQTVGLTGIFDGDTSNDFSYLNGTTSISSNSTESEIFDWASTCTYENNHTWFWIMHTELWFLALRLLGSLLDKLLDCHANVVIDLPNFFHCSLCYDFHTIINI